MITVIPKAWKAKGNLVAGQEARFPHTNGDVPAGAHKSLRVEAAMISLYHSSADWIIVLLR
ncbi:hypothetical protein HO173_000506 [Letharia columbiana]|uniref:Uncharacterized protein n=1 Tax=Letharia columbiana TaxID=112416 RepID=A0A8H6G7M6_9LECA|nr:uncharacterized protein HO173_000506 [Letharia columbiana]KAF6241794.1 hypothetical protein HO173_000506 [Letharia columbiana]